MQKRGKSGPNKVVILKQCVRRRETTSKNLSKHELVVSCCKSFLNHAPRGKFQKSGFLKKLQRETTNLTWNNVKPLNYENLQRETTNSCLHGFFKVVSVPLTHFLRSQLYLDLISLFSVLQGCLIKRRNVTFYEIAHNMAQNQYFFKNLFSQKIRNSELQFALNSFEKYQSVAELQPFRIPWDKKTTLYLTSRMSGRDVDVGRVWATTDQGPGTYPTAISIGFSYNEWRLFRVQLSFHRYFAVL